MWLVLLCASLSIVLVQGSAAQTQAAAPTRSSPTASATPQPGINGPIASSPNLPGVIWPLYIPILRLDPSPTPTDTPTPTNTPPATATATATPTPTATHTMHTPSEFLYCSSPGLSIPDNSTSGARDDLLITKEGILLDLEVFVRINHSYVGDLAVEVVQRSTGLSSVLVDRPGLANNAPASLVGVSLGCALDNIQAIFDSQAEQTAENKCQTNSMVNVAIGGIFKAHSGLDQLRGQTAAGTYSLLASDVALGDTGKVEKWCLHGWVGNALPVTPTPTPTSLPDSAVISGMSGKSQALPLDCETRSAVDWAKKFGVAIDEMAFFNALPTSDNPDTGFVGNVYGTWGNIPPNDYGVHAWPIEHGLRGYGLIASAQRGLSLNDLRAEIAWGNPVIVWVSGHVLPGAPEYYRAPSDQEISIVARYEHTVIIYGYTPWVVYILDGSDTYTASMDRFLDAWSALGNMAVLARP